MFVPERYFRDAFVVVNGTVAYEPDLRDTWDLVGVGVHDSFSHLVCFVDVILCLGVERLGTEYTLFIQIVDSANTYLDQGELLFKGQVDISKQKEVMLSLRLVSRTPEFYMKNTLYKASSISLNSSAVQFPGWISLTSLPKSENFSRSTLAGRTRGASFMVIVMIGKDEDLIRALA